MSVYLRVSQRSPRIPEPLSTWVEGDQQQDQPIQLSWTSWFTNGPIMLSISFHLSAPQMAKRFFSACRWTLDWSFIHWLWHHGGPGLDAVVRSSSNLGLFPHVDRRVRCVHRQHRDNVVRRSPSRGAASSAPNADTVCPRKSGQCRSWRRNCDHKPVCDNDPRTFTFNFVNKGGV